MFIAKTGNRKIFPQGGIWCCVEIGFFKAKKKIFMRILPGEVTFLSEIENWVKAG